MEIYLIRHTTPAVEAGTCYGQADLDVIETFEQEASIIKQYLPLHRCTAVRSNAVKNWLIIYFRNMTLIIKVI